MSESNWRNSLNLARQSFPSKYIVSILLGPFWRFFFPGSKIVSSCRLDLETIGLFKARPTHNTHLFFFLLYYFNIFHNRTGKILVNGLLVFLKEEIICYNIVYYSLYFVRNRVAKLSRQKSDFSKRGLALRRLSANVWYKGGMFCPKCCDFAILNVEIASELFNPLKTFIFESAF